MKKKPKRRIAWPRLRAMAFKLRLPGVEETTSWGEPTLKAHGKLWVWWSPHEDAPVFKVPFEERDVLVEAAPDTFFFTPHYKSWPLVLVYPEKLDLQWAKANLIRVWREQAPKRVLKAYDEARQRSSLKRNRSPVRSSRPPIKVGAKPKRGHRAT